MFWKVLYHPLIQEDLTGAYLWYENQQEGLGDRFVKAVETKLAIIEERPKAFGSRSNKNYREAKIEGFPYLISYRIYETKKLIFVASLHHTKKHPRKKYRD